MKKTLLLLVSAALLVSCGEGRKNQELSASNDSLQNVVAQKDSIINDAFTSISEISANIDLITQREKIVSTQTNGELTKSVKEQISDNITAIGQLLEKNRAEIARLQSASKQLKAANVKIDGLQKLVAQLQEQVRSKDAQIAQLSEKLQALNIEVGALQQTVSGLESDKAQLNTTVAAQDSALHNVYYIVGSDKELIAKQIIDKKGLIGRTRVLGENASMNGFTKVDYRKLEHIPIGKAKVRIVTSHPDNSYLLVKSDKEVIKELVITDKKAFWDHSKVLVISHK